MTSALKAKPIVEWHRVAGARAIIKPLFLGAFVLTLGPAIAVTCIIIGRTTHWVETIGLICAGACVLAGPVIALWGLSRAFRNDAFLAARVDGVTFERNGKGTTLTWDEVETVSFEPPHALVFRLREGDPFVIHERFDIETNELAKRFETLRRKASMQLL